MKGVEGLHLKEGEHRQMGYAEDFKQFIEKHKDEHLLKRFKELEKRLENEPYGTVHTDGDLTAEIDAERSRAGRLCFKVKFGEDIFFVKREIKGSASREEHHSINKAHTAVRAKEALQILDGVRVVNPQLAFKDERYSYFVSRWIVLPSFSEYIDGILPRRFSGDDRSSREELNKRQEELGQRWRVVVDTLRGALSEEERKAGYRFYDSGNAFYDEETDSIVLFDQHIININK
jgi:hypothetical protein